jgi:hypothetical protein
MQNKQNVASLELCKELLELSGWDDTKQVWKYTEPMSTDIKYGVREDGDKWCYSVQPHSMKSYNLNEVSVWSAYDSGYLLRKLPAELLLTKLRNGDVRFQIKHHTAEKLYGVLADTPEDALTQLAIQLFKSGELTK